MLRCDDVCRLFTGAAGRSGSTADKMAKERSELLVVTPTLAPCMLRQIPALPDAEAKQAALSKNQILEAPG